MKTSRTRLFAFLWTLVPGLLAADIARCVIPDSMQNAEMPWAVDISGDYAVLGQMVDYGLPGAAYVFTRQAAGTWEIQAQLEPTDTATDWEFGIAVAIRDTDACVLGSNGVYVFHRRLDSGWEYDTVLPFPESIAFRRLRGSTIRMNERYIVLGLPLTGQDPDYTGAVVVYRRTAENTWSHEAQFPLSNIPSKKDFGAAIALYDSVIVAGTGYETGDSGSVYTYTQSPAGIWHEHRTMSISSEPDALWRNESGLYVGLRENDSLYLRHHAVDADQDSVYNLSRGFVPEECESRRMSLTIKGNRLLLGISSCLTGGTIHVYEKSKHGWHRERMLLVPELMDSYDNYFYHIGSHIAVSYPFTVAGVNRQGSYTHDVGAYIFDLTNNPPTRITFTAAMEPDNPAFVGELAATDADENDTHLFRFPESSNEERFRVEGNRLLAKDDAPASNATLFRFELVAIDQDGAAVMQLMESSNRAIPNVRIPIPSDHASRLSCYNGTAAFSCKDTITGGYNIHYWNGRTTIPLTRGASYHSHPSLHERSVAWLHDERKADVAELKYWDGSEISTVDTISIKNLYDAEPSLHDGRIAYAGRDGNDWEIYLWDGTQVIRMTDNDYYDGHAVLDGTTMAWLSATDGVTREVMYYDGDELKQITHSEWGNHVRDLTLSDGQITWYQSDGDDYETWFWDGRSIHRLSNDGFQDRAPVISSGQIAWHIKYGQKNGAIAFFDGEYTYILDTPFHVPNVALSHGGILYTDVDAEGNYGLYYLDTRKARKEAMKANTDLYYSNPNSPVRPPSAESSDILPGKKPRYVVTVYDLRGKRMHRRVVSNPAKGYRSPHAANGQAYIMHLQSYDHGRATLKWAKGVVVR